MVFKPDYVTRTRQGSSTFHGSFAAPGKLVTGVAGAPLKVGGFAVGGISKGANFIKKNTFGRNRTNTQGTGDIEIVEPELERTTTQPGNGFPPLGAGSRPKSSGSGARNDGANDSRLSTPERDGRSALSPSSAFGASPHARSRSTSSQHTLPGAGGAGSAESGTATIRVLSASGYPAGTNVQVRIRSLEKGKDLLKSKTIKTANSSGEWVFDESISIQALASAQYKVSVKDNHLFKDEEMGEGLFVVDDSNQNGGEITVQVGMGTVRLRTVFKVGLPGVPGSGGGGGGGGSGSLGLGAGSIFGRPSGETLRGDEVKKKGGLLRRGLLKK
jgi:hypothetical protein